MRITYCVGNTEDSSIWFKWFLLLPAWKSVLFLVFQDHVLWIGHLQRIQKKSQEILRLKRKKWVLLLKKKKKTTLSLTVVAKQCINLKMHYYIILIFFLKKTSTSTRTGSKIFEKVSKSVINFKNSVCVCVCVCVCVSTSYRLICVKCSK